MASPYKREQEGYIEITRMNTEGVQKLVIQNLPKTHVDVGQHYNKGMITVNFEEAENLIQMLAKEIGKKVTLK